VVGAAHPRWGEAVVAVIVPAKGNAEPPDPAALTAYCAERVGKWEVPKYIEFVDALPIGSTGKIQKREIREWFRVAPERLPWPSVDS
jgi:acyl-CoA synthetase (AMP-forming)/AMP-acid ligase II